MTGKPGPAGGATVTVAGAGVPGSGAGGRLYGNRLGPASTGGRTAVCACATAPEPPTSPSAIRVAAHRLLRMFPSPGPSVPVLRDESVVPVRRVEQKLPARGDVPVLHNRRGRGPSAGPVNTTCLFVGAEPSPGRPGRGPFLRWAAAMSQKTWGG